MLGISTTQSALQKNKRSNADKNYDEIKKNDNKGNNQGGLVGGLGYLGASLIAGVGQVGEGIIDLVAAGGASILGDFEYAKNVFDDNVVGDWYSDVEEWYNPDDVMGFIGDVGQGLGQSAYALLSFIPVVGPALATGSIVAGATGQGISEATAKTGELGLKEIAYGIGTGAVEGALEYVTGAGGQIIKSAAKKVGANVTKNAVRKGALKNILSSASGEFVEEFLSSYAEVGLQHITGVDSQAQYSLSDALYSGAVGFVSGGVLGGASVGMSSAANQRRGAQIVRKGNSQTLVNTATVFADAMADKGTDFEKTADHIKALRGQVDAYNNLPNTAKTSIRGQVILGEMQTTLALAETNANVQAIKAAISSADDVQRTALAQYASKVTGKKYTANDIKSDTDKVTSQLAILNFANGIVSSIVSVKQMNDAQMEQRIASVITNEQSRAGVVQNDNDAVKQFNNGKVPADNSVQRIKYDLMTPEERNAQTKNNMSLVKTSASSISITGEEFRKSEIDLVTQVDNYFKSVGGKAYNEELGEVILDRRGVKDDIAHGIGRKKAAAFAAVPEAVERGKVVNYQTNWKGRGYDTAVIATPVNIAGKSHLMGIVAIREQNNNRFYVHEVLSIEEGALSFKTGTANESGTPGDKAPSVFSILQKIAKVNPDSEKSSAGGDIRRRENSSAKGLSNSAKSGTIESTQSRKEVSDGKESGKQENERSDRRTEGGTPEKQSGTRTQAGDGSRVQGRMGGAPQKTGEILGASNEGLHRVESDGRTIPFDPNEISEITKNDVLYEHRQKVVNEYGVDCFVIKNAAWEKLNLDGPAGAYKGKVYVSEDISSELLPTTAPHEGTHIMKQLKYQPYLDFIDKTPEMLDFSSNETARLLGWICDHVGVDYLSMNAAEATRLYDEMNAGIYGFYKAGMLEGEGLSEWVPNAFYDFDSYIAELDAIHEQYKQEVKAKKDFSRTSPTANSGAIWQYKSSESYKINEAIRSGRELTAEDSAFIEELDRDLEKTPKYSGVTYRNISFDMQGQEAFDAFVAEHVEGELITYNAYTSTSKSETGYVVDGELTAHIEIYGENGHDISQGYGLEKEQEVLYGRKTRFVVTSVSYDGKTANIVMEEFANGERAIQRGIEGNKPTQQGHNTSNIKSSMQQMQESLPEESDDNLQDVSQRSTRRDSGQRSDLQGVRGEVSTDADPDVQQAEQEKTIESEKASVEQRAREMLREWEQWQEKAKPTAEEMNRAREYVKDFDDYAYKDRLRAMRTMRSADGVDTKIVQGVVNLMLAHDRNGRLLNPDLEFRFAEGISDRGLHTKVGGKSLVVINKDTDFKNTVYGTIAHEIVHYIEKRQGYKELAEYVRKTAKAEKIAEIEKEYRDFWESTDHKYTQEDLDREVTARLVGERIMSERFLKRYAEKDDQMIKRVGRFLKETVAYLKVKDRTSYEITANIVARLDKAIASETVEFSNDVEIQRDLAPKQDEKNAEKKAGAQKARTGSSEARRAANGFAREFKLSKKASDSITAQLEAIEDAFVKLDREAYLDEYRKRTQAIYNIVFNDGALVLSESSEYHEFSRYLYGKRFRVDRRFREDMGHEWKDIQKALRGRIAADTNRKAPHVDSFYAELNELFPGLFPPDIVNIHDQLNRISKVIADSKGDQSIVYSVNRLPSDMHADIAVNIIERVDSYVTRVSSNRDIIKQVKAERDTLEHQLRDLRLKREKDAKERSQAAASESARTYTKKEIREAIEAITKLTDDQIKAYGRGQFNMSLAQKDAVAHDIYVALHDASATGEAGKGSVQVKIIAANIAWDIIDSGRIVGDDGRSYHFGDGLDESTLQMLAEELTESLYSSFAEMGSNTVYADLMAKVRSVKEGFRQKYLDDNKLQKHVKTVTYEATQFRQMSEQQKRTGEDEGIYSVTKLLGAIVDSKGNIIVGRVDAAIAEADRFYNMQSEKINSQSGDSLTDFVRENDADLSYMIDEFKRLRSRVEKNGKDRTGRFLDGEEMMLLGKILGGVKRVIKEFNKVYVNGHWVDVDSMAQESAADMSSYFGSEKEYKTRLGKFLGGTVGKGINQVYFYNMLSPESVIEALEGYKRDGALKRLYRQVRVAKQRSEHLSVKLKKPFYEFLDSKGKNDNIKVDPTWTDDNGRRRTYRQKLNEKVINVNGHEITLGEAIYLYMLTKRDHAHAGLVESGFVLYDENNQRKKKIKIPDIARTRDFIYKQFDDADVVYLSMAEKFFNKTSTEIKSAADIEILGYTNVQYGYYVPIIRDRYGRMLGVTDSRQSIGSIVTVYNKSFNQNIVANAKALEGKNIQAIIDDHADGLADYAELYLPLKSFDRFYNRAVTIDGETTTVREILHNNVWSGSEKYLKNLFSDIQGQSRGDSGPIDKIVGNIRGAWVNSVLGLNLKVVATQTTSYIAANQVIEAKYLSQALSKFVGDQSELGARADEFSDIIEARSFDGGSLRAQGNIDRVQELGKKSGFMIEWMDRRVCLAIFHAAELKAEAEGAGAVGTVENAKRAANIADEAIYQTQAMTSQAERSALQRAKSEVAKTFSMFTADTVKNLSHMYSNTMRYFAHKERAKSDTSYESEISKDARKIGRSAATLISVGVMIGLITQGFKYLYGKEEEEPEDKAKDLAIDIVSSTINILPIVSDVADKFIFGYDMSLNVFDIANDTIEDTKNMFDMAATAMSGGYVSQQDIGKNTINFAKTLGIWVGAPIAPVERTVMGLLRRFAPKTIYGYDSMFGYTNYTSDLKAAVESGDETLAQHILATLYRNEVNGIYASEELSEVVRLYSSGYTDVLPSKIPSDVSTREQRRRFTSIYQGASDAVIRLISCDEYEELSDEQRAKAIKNTYKLYYDTAKTQVIAAEMTKSQAYAKLLSNDTSKIFIARSYKSGLNEIKDKRGNVISVREQFLEYLKSLDLSDEQYIVIAYANGVRDKQTRARLISIINSQNITASEKEQIAICLGFDFSNGKVSEKQE